MSDATEQIKRKFRSGNAVPVERAWVTSEEWEAARHEIAELEQAASALYGLALTRCQGRNDPLFAAAARVGDVLSGEDKGNG